MPFAARLQFDWRLRRRTLRLGHRTVLMGILNITPDSFSDGGQYLDPAAALDHAMAMLDDGADILDLGGESTRPGSAPIAPAEEQARVLPVLRGILAARPAAVVSIDTYHAETARLAIEAGAEIVNDVSGLLWDPAMAAACAALGCGLVLMHTRGRPQQWRTQPALAHDEVVPMVLGGLRERSDAALAAGVNSDSLVLDPGFGFGKVLDENYPLLAGLDELHALGFPILAGVSRKSFLRPRQAAGPAARPAHTASQAELPSAAASTAAILAGAHILRVHDVRAARAAAGVADRILDARCFNKDE